ncbi:MAG: hypothetical protein QOC66_327 [Pseudonocardiales bacterium]|nr:hypothetical protein [Pseudonocardiales bacterium]
MRPYHRKTTRRSAALLCALAGALVAATAVDAGATPADQPAGQPAGHQSSPWTNPDYVPRAGDWQPYVLAPQSHTVRPTSVLFADPRGGSVTGDPEAALGDQASVTLHSTGPRTSSPLLALDFGKEVGGEIRVRVTGASTPAPALHVCFSESKSQMALTPTQNNGEAAYAPGCDTANIWNGYPGQPYSYDADSHTLSFDAAALPAAVQDKQPRGGFRYATFFLDGPGSVSLSDVSLDFQAAPKQADPAAYAGWFLSSDNELNKLWYAGAYTVQMNTWMSDTAKSWPYANGEADHSDAQIPHADPQQEVILDGAKRDRVVWQGDLAVQAPVTYLSTGDVAAVDNSLTSLAAQQLPDGYMPAESLVGQHNFDELRTYGEYVTWFVHNEYEHWLYTGDRGYLDANWAALTRAMAWLESVRAQDPQGLIAFGSVGSCGHYGYSDCGHETYVNALYARNLDEMASLARVRGSDAATYAARAATVAAAINAQLWDPAVGAYRLSREIPTAYPQDANATAVLTGVASAAQATRALAYLRKHNWSTYGSLTVSPETPNPSISPSYEPLPSGFEAQARLAAADPSGLSQLQGEQLLRQYWGYQLGQDPGSTFWEKVNPSGDPTIGQFTSLAHGWASAPTAALTNETLGVTPTSGGYATFAVIPHPGDLDWAQGVVPTPHGSIAASWASTHAGFTLQTTVPGGTHASLSVPTSGSKVVVQLDGHVVWNGRRALGGAEVTSDGTYVTVSGVGAGRHTMTARRASLATTLSVVTTPTSASVVAGATMSVHAVVSGTAQSPLTARVSASAPAGWSVDPTAQDVALGDQGRPASGAADFTVSVPADAKPGTYPVTVSADANGVRAEDAVAVTVEPPGYSFESGTMGWQPGANTAGVARVTSFANRPGSCVSGGCLQVTGAQVPATTVRSAYVAPGQPLDLSAASTLQLAFNCYGGVPGATGYEAVVTLTGAGGAVLTKQFAVSPDAWTTLSLDVADWAGAAAVTRIEVGFAAVGTTFAPWNGSFQIDDVTWS